MKALNLTIAMITLTTSLSSFAYNPVEADRLAKGIRKAKIELATKLVEAHTKKYVCDTDAYTNTVVKAITSIADIRQASDTRRLWTQINANVQLRTNLLLKYFFSDSTASDARSLAKLMIGTSLYSLGEGAYGSTLSVSFTNEHEVVISTLNIDTDTPTWNKRKGTWSLTSDGSNFILKINNGTKEESFTLSTESLYYKMHSQGEITFEGGEIHRGLSTSPSECEA